MASTIALLAAFFSVTRIPPGLKPGGTEPTYTADQAQRRPKFAVRSNAKGKALGQDPFTA